MFAVISPAKSLKVRPLTEGLTWSEPRFIDEASALTDRLRGLEAPQLSALMGISDALATLNRDRFAQWTPDHTAAQPALSLFAGDVYVGLDAPTLSMDALAFGQEHLGILSGLYGLLRPLDRIHPYRLEMGTVGVGSKKGDLAAHWRGTVSRTLRDVLQGAPLINLASAEYFSAVDPKAVGAPVIEAVFQEEKGGKRRTLSFFAKRARGLMARFILTHRINSPEGLKDFDLGGYRFEPSVSTPSRWVFARPQPPSAAEAAGTGEAEGTDEGDA